MQLFKRRPLCFFCFVFALVCLLATNISFEAKLWISAALVCLTVLIGISVFFAKRAKSTILYCLLTLIFICAAILSSFIGIDLAQKRAEGYVGERAVKLSVLDKEYSSSYSSAYTVRIENVDGKRTSVKALLLLKFNSDLDVGDVSYVNSRLVPIDSKVFGISGGSIVEDSDVLLMCVVDGEAQGYVSRFDRTAPIYKKLMSKSGATVVLSEIKNGITKRANTLLGTYTGSLACGFLIGDTENIPALVIRDFRRSGVSHLLAVSGMHISILLGAVELLFRRLYIPKLVRCATVSLLAFVLLCLTGFSMSAMRSVLMLWITYLIFMLSEEADAPTVLFGALFIILLLFPYAVYDVGMWMSFLATLGIITLYPLVLEKLPRSKSENLFVKGTYSLGRTTVLAVALTVIANMFLLYIMCTVFGELSISAIPANILLSPLSTVFMFVCVAAIALGDVLLIGVALSFLCGKLGALITLITGTFSCFEWSVVSLRPTYARVIVISLSVCLAVMLVIKIKHKWVFAAVPTAFAVAFCACAVARSATYDTNAIYSYTRTNEAICITDGKSASILDMSGGGYEYYSELLSEAANSGATEIDTVVITRVTGEHLSTMKYMLRHKMVKNICIPYPQDRELDISLALAEIADECGVSVSIYGEAPVRLLDGVYLCADTDSSSWCLANGEHILGYVDGNTAFSKILATSSECLIFGSNLTEEYYCEPPDNANIIYSSPEAFEKQRRRGSEENTYVNVYDKLKLRIKLE